MIYNKRLENSAFCFFKTFKLICRLNQEPMKKADFKDVSFVTKARSTSYFCYQVAFQDQKPVFPEIITDFKRTMQHALDHHYCVSFISCPFDFNFESLLSHFKWCCKFLYFNFSETTMQFDIFKRLKVVAWSEQELNTLLTAVSTHHEPYTYSLNRYSGEIKFALMKRENAGREPAFQQLLIRDKSCRDRLTKYLQTLLASQHHQVPVRIEMTPTVVHSPQKYDASKYGYLKITDDLNAEKQKEVISYLYDLLNALFIKPYSLEEFSMIFRKNEAAAIELNLAQANPTNLDAQKLHLLFRQLKDEKILIASWQLIQEKLWVYNHAGERVNSVYQISKGKISNDKARQVYKLLKPVSELLP
jgi:hypothetical protein